MKRSLKLPLLIALALASGHALALDLGQIQVKSALGQPLLAEIPVQQATPAELQKLSVQLASGDEFARAGVNAGRPDIPLHFEVVDGEGGHKVIRITSQAAVNDPFLDLLIEIHGGTGKSVREFTILLDPPGSNPTPVAARATAPSRPAAPAAVSTQPGPRPAPPARASGGQVANGQFGPVERGQTLSAVARRTVPAGVDVNQMMLALKQANPEAFYRDNINALKAGVVLRVPDKAEAEAVAVAAAVAQVRRQNGDWRNGSVASSPVTVADAGTRAATSSSPTATAAPKGDHLALVPAAKAGSKAAAAGNDERDAAGKQDLLRSQEALASLQQQSDNLKSRLKDLTDINSKNERLLALKDNEIAELQAKLAAARKASGLPAAVASTAVAGASGAGSTAPTAAASVAKAAAPAASTGGPATATTTAPVASKPAAEAAATPVAQTTPMKPSAITPSHPASEEPWYTQLWAQALGGAIVVLLLLLALLSRRRGGKKGGAPESAPSLADRFVATPSTDPDTVDGGDDADQAHLLDQLAEHPDDIGLHLELVSLYYGRRDVEHFEAAAEAMHAHVTDPQQEEWQQVLRMGEDLTPAHPLFAGHDDETVPAEPGASFDIDHFQAADVTSPAPAADVTPAAPPPFPADPVKVSEYSFNFDLTPAMDPAPAPAAQAHEPGAAVDAQQEAAAEPPAADPLADWHFEEPPAPAAGTAQDIETFNDDPVDTKLDLARAYLDMGDPEGARAMLEEVMQEGSQMQRDVAQRMLDDLH